ncbi:MAG TPA: conjugal transfer protein [Solirubrobacterales bacterium]|nr:conjugal transfer protein [Solirubrobacterales bacterium]
MAFGVGNRFRRRQAERRTLGSALRAAGRTALWLAVALLLVRGTASVLSAPKRGAGTEASRALLDPATSAFAVRFARAYLEGAGPELASLAAPGVHVAAASPGGGAAVEQAEVAGAREEAGGDQALVTVACQLAGARTLYLAVPIVREVAGEVAASGAPAVVAGPAGVGEGTEAPRPLAGPGAAAIAELAHRFLSAYFSAAGPGDLSYLLAPGVRVTPPGDGLELVGVGSVEQTEAGEGARRTVVAGARVRDPASGAVYSLAYRLEVARRGRWYVEAVEGALS